MSAVRTRRIDSPRCFLHVPKSAGSSVYAALEAALPPGSIAPRRFDKSIFADFHDFELLRQEVRDLVALDRDEVHALSSYRAVCGHFSLATLLQITAASSISTVLREPRARLLSLYIYWRVPGIGDPWAPYRANDHAQRPLWEFLSEPRLAPVLDNQVCRLLLDGDSRLPESGFAAQSDIESLAADAIGQLETLGFVGVMELGDSVWRGLTGIFEVKLEPTKLNVTEQLEGPIAGGPGKKLLTSEALDLIERHSAADLLVYDHVLARAGLDASERRRLTHGAFAHQLVKLGDLVGHSATRLADQIEVLRTTAERKQRQSQAALEESRDRLFAREQAIQRHEDEIKDLESELRCRDEELDRLRRWLDAVHASGSWRLTTPLRAAKHGMQRLRPTRDGSATPTREDSLLAGCSVSQVWWFALVLCSIIAATDAVLSHVVLIALLTAGPFCGVLTGRWARTATVGIWAVALAVLLGIPDKIWDTSTQLVDLGAVAIVALLSTSAALLIERHRYAQMG